MHCAPLSPPSYRTERPMTASNTTQRRELALLLCRIEPYTIAELLEIAKQHNPRQHQCPHCMHPHPCRTVRLIAAYVAKGRRTP